MNSSTVEASVHRGPSCRSCGILLAVLIFTFSVLPGTADAQKSSFKIWPEDRMPASARSFSAAEAEQLREKQTAERVMLVEHPNLTVYRPSADQANGCAVLVCPGGGYNILALEKEGVELAEWFNSIGVTAFVLQYRVPRRGEAIHREPMQDVQRAIRTVRHRANEWEIDPDRIGVLGFSAGGHLTVMAGLQSDTRCYDPMDEIDQVDARPNFICPIYAAYLGPDYRDDVAELSDLVQVDHQSPPTFMAVTMDDRMRGAQAGLLLARLKQAGIPAELHAYTAGGHGYGIRPSDRPVSKWNLQLAAWLEAMNLLKPDSPAAGN